MKKTNPKKPKTEALNDVEERSQTNDLTSNKGVLELMVERGAKAWKDVPDASAWVEELRGNDVE
jgi:hypothetical protein